MIKYTHFNRKNKLRNFNKFMKFPKKALHVQLTMSVVTMKYHLYHLACLYSSKTIIIINDDHLQNCGNMLTMSFYEQIKVRLT